MKQEVKEWMDMFMMKKSEKKSRLGFGLTLERMTTLKNQTMTSLPYYLAKAYQTP